MSKFLVTYNCTIEVVVDAEDEQDAENKTKRDVSNIAQEYKCIDVIQLGEAK
jgi:hypothetical protein